LGARTNGARRQEQTFSDWCAEIRELAGERWPEFSDQAPTLYVVRNLPGWLLAEIIGTVVADK
jgi:hypothetical protein